jgi:SAM-dependent methyltransferase
MSVAGCRAAYDEHAAQYSQLLDPTLAGVVERLAQLAEARPGARLLDLATGTGAVARAAGQRGATVVGVDVSEAMIGVACEMSPGVEFRLADAHALPFKDVDFDVVTCGLALSHFHEPLKALGEVLRVLRDGGRLVASTWGPGGGTRASGTVVEILKRHGATDKGYTLDEGTWLSAEKGSELLRRAGFACVSVHTETFRGRFEDVEEALQWTLAWPCGAARLQRLDASAQDAFLADAREVLAGSDLSWTFVFNLFVADKRSGDDTPTGSRAGRGDRADEYDGRASSH